MTIKRKKFLSVAISLIMIVAIILTTFSRINPIGFYAQEEQDKWITKFDILEVLNQENIIKIEIGYNNLESLEKNEKLEKLNFYIQDEENKIQIEPTQDSTLKLNQALKNNANIQLDLDISQVDLMQFTNPNIKVVPIIKKQTPLDITDLMNYQNKLISINLEENEYKELEQIYNNSTQIKKQELTNTITKGQYAQVLDENTFKLELEKYIQEKIYETLEQDEINQNISEIMKKKQFQEQSSNENIIIEINEIKNLQNKLDEKLNNIKKEQLSALNSLALNTETNNIQNENIDNLKIDEERLEDDKINAPVSNQKNEIIGDDSNQASSDNQNTNLEEENTSTFETINPSEIQEITKNDNKEQENVEPKENIEEGIKENTNEPTPKNSQTSNLEFKQLETISSISINENKLKVKEILNENTVMVFETKEDENNEIITPLFVSANNQDIVFELTRLNESVYSNKSLNFEINISSNNSSSDIIDPYIDVTIPNEYLLNEHFVSSKKGADLDTKIYRKKEETIKSDKKDETILRIYIHTIKGNSDTKIRLPISLNLIPRRTPNNYSIAPKIELFDSTGKLIKMHNEDKSVYISIKYEKPKLFKSISRQENTSKKYTSNIAIKGIDAHIVYGGQFKNNTQIIDETKTEDIEFYYSLSTVAKIGNPETYKENQDNRIPGGYKEGYELKSVNQYSSGKNEVPIYKKIVIKDVLPKYIGADGKEYKAKFEQDKNPDWVYDSNEETVSFTVSPKGRVLAEDILHNNVKLILSFPNFKGVLPDSKGEYNLEDEKMQEYVIKNKAEAELYHINSDEITKIEDELQFILNGNLLGGRGIFSKDNIQQRKIKVEKNAMHLYSSDYRITIANPYSKPMKNITITEEDFDERYFVKNIFWDIKDLPAEIVEGFDGIYGITQDNQEVKIIDKDNIEKITKRNNHIVSTINPDIQEQILENVRKLRANEILKKDIQNINPKYKSIKFKMKEGFELNKNQSISFIVQMGFISPYNLEVDKNIGKNTNNNLYNKAKLNMTMSDIDYETVSGDFADLEEKDFYNNMGLDPSGNLQNKSEGSKFDFIFDVDLRNMPKLSRYNNPYIVILLPRGLDLDDDEKRYGNTFLNDYDRDSLSKLIKDEYIYSQKNKNGSINLKAIEVKNFDSAGNRALIYPLKDFDAYEATGTMLIKIPVKINKESLTLSIAKQNLAHNKDANKAYLFFYADNLQDSMKDANEDNVDEKYKEDEFKIIDMLEEKGLRKLKDQKKLLTSSKKYEATTATKSNSEKFIRLKDGDWKEEIDTDYGESFEYKLSVRNFSNNQNISNIIIYDVLPYKGYNNSKFSNYMQKGVKANIGGQDNTDLFEFYYYIGKSNPSSNINKYIKNNNLELSPNDWTNTPTNFKQVRAVLIKAKDGTLVKSGQIQDFIFDMKAPEYSGENLIDKKAINNYDISINDEKFSKINDVSNKIAKKISTVVAKYIVVDEKGNPVTDLDENTKKLFENAKETYTGKIGQNYTTEQKYFPKYKFLEADETKGEKTAQFEEREKEVIYKYIIKKGTVIARYIEVDEKGKPTGKILQEPITITGDLDTNYETEQKSFDKYEFVGIDETKDNPTGQFEEREKEVVYKYTAEKVDNPPKGGGSPSNPPKSEENKPKTPDKPEEKEQTPPVKPENPTSSSDDTPTNETEKEKPKEEQPKREEPKNETPKIEQPPTDDSEKPIIPTSLEPKNEEQTPPVEPNNNTPSTETQEIAPIYDRPSINPPTNTPFVPQRIINIPPNRSEEMVVMVIDENGTPLGKAVINPQDNSYTFIDDERTPMGTAKLHNDNVLEILDKNVPKSFPKTGQEGNTLYYLLGLGMISLAIGLKKKRNKK